MRVSFLFADQKKQYEGVVRPFLNFVKGMKDKSEVSFALLRCGNELVDYIRTNLGVSMVVTKNQNDLTNKLIKLKPQFVIADDYPSRLKLLDAIKRKVKSNAVVYAQILYGSHAISNCFDLTSLSFPEKSLFTLCRLIPFSILAKRYRIKLDRCDTIIANSKSTATLLQIIYGKEINGIVYPPIDTETFKPMSSKKSKEVVLYAGSHVGDTQKSFMEEIVRKLLKLSFGINLLGNINFSLAMKRRYPEILYHKNLDDTELAELYSKSIVTICPQKWETFGYVQVESMACGTPVVAFGCMGPLETIINWKTGWTAKNKQEFLKTLDFILKNRKSRLDQIFIRRHIEKNFSVDVSARNLEKVLMAKINE